MCKVAYKLSCLKSLLALSFINYRHNVIKLVVCKIQPTVVRRYVLKSDLLLIKQTISVYARTCFRRESHERTQYNEN